jgi:hypothetical protein
VVWLQDRSFPIEQSGDGPTIVVPEVFFRSLGISAPLRLPGWEAVTILVPPRDAQGRATVAEPVQLVRSVSSFRLEMPAAGCDYAAVELVWKAPHNEEPSATPPATPLSRTLSFRGEQLWEAIPTGTYKLVLKGANPRTVPDFCLDDDLRITKPGRGGDGLTRVLPPTLSGSYITYVPDHQSSSGREVNASFYGVRLDMAKGTGEVLAAISPIREGAEITLRHLKPRPDTLWPVSNLVLREPVRCEFDCPLFFVDYRLTLSTADGVITIKGEFIPPEDPRSQADLLARMRLLCRQQMQRAFTDATPFAPGSVSSDYQRLPYFSVLANPDVFGQHLRDRRHHVHDLLELGTSVVMTRGNGGAWEARLLAAPTTRR